MKLAIGDMFTGTVRDLAALGAGVVDAPNGQVFFAEGTVPGDTGQFRVTALDKRYGFAELVQLTSASALRVPAPCRYQGTTASSCHGCPWMVVAYSEQLARKQQTVVHMLTRNKLLHEQTEVAAIAESPSPLHYRNRAQVKTDGVRLGFVGSQKDIIDIEECLVLNEDTASRLHSLRSRLPTQEWQPAAGRQWNFIDIDDQIDVTDLVPNRRLNFRQANDEQNEFMKSWLHALMLTLDVPRTSEVLELFCGSGNFTKVLSNAGFATIVAVEASNDAVTTLNAKRLPGVTARSLDLYRDNAVQRLGQLISKPRVLVIDPPRTGYKALANLVGAFPTLEHLVYISCDLPSFSYDTLKLLPGGWLLRSVQPVDQFPHTPHVELMTHFVKAPQ